MITVRFNCILSKMDYPVQKLAPEVSNLLKECYRNELICNNLSYIGPKKYVLSSDEKLLESFKSFEVRQDDVWVGGFSRSGTHWLAEGIWLLCNNLDYERALTTLHEERVSYFDFHPKVFENFTESKYRSHTMAFGGLPSPRYFKTHLPLSLLPPDLLDKIKMVYIIRDPRDVVVSCYNFYKNHMTFQFRKGLKEFWDLFRNDLCVYCPYFENIKEYWKFKDHPNLLILFYEKMHEDLQGSIKHVAKFLDKKITDEQLDCLIQHLEFSNMKNNKTVNVDEMLGDKAHEVVRKGIAGGWRNEFDEQMTKEAEEWLAENLRDIDLKFD